MSWTPVYFQPNDTGVRPCLTFYQGFKIVRPNITERLESGGTVFLPSEVSGGQVLLPHFACFARQATRVKIRQFFLP